MNQVENIKAFLDMIAKAEGTSTSPATRNNGYDVIVTGIDGKPEVFTDYSAHPFAGGRKSKVINSKGLTSNASGRYQFMLRDYAHYRDLLKLKDFSPDAQDKWAIRLIKERRALEDVEAGRIPDAIRKVSNIWASLPGNTYGQPVKGLPKLLAWYEEAGGTLEA